MNAIVLAALVTAGSTFGGAPELRGSMDVPFAGDRTSPVMTAARGPHLLATALVRSAGSDAEMGLPLPAALPWQDRAGLVPLVRPVPVEAKHVSGPVSRIFAESPLETPWDHWEDRSLDWSDWDFPDFSNR